jgi:3-deoxy-D-manno-octulosonate 8-phosphate phosphatase (KDO 8-P phosphatase)
VRMNTTPPTAAAPGPAMIASGPATGTAVAREAWARVRLFAMDVDGILTDGTVFVSSDGVETKQFSVLDGLGLKRTLTAGVILAWISGRVSGATTRRAEELGIPHVIQGRHDKAVALQELATAVGVPLSDVAYMGDDDIDAPALRLAGIGISVPEAMPSALAAARHVTQRAAGRGAVREICDLLLAARAPITPSPP